jgi:hypothetical protein
MKTTPNIISDTVKSIERIKGNFGFCYKITFANRAIFYYNGMTELSVFKFFTVGQPARFTYQIRNKYKVIDVIDYVF